MLEKFKFIRGENRLVNFIYLSIKTIQAMEFRKYSGFFGRVFPQKTFVFQWKQTKIKFSLNFCFASFDSLKAVTGCF